MKKLNAYEVMGLIKAKQIQKQKGASMIEYALVVAGVAAIAAVLFAGGTNGGGSVGDAIHTKVTASIP
ncbi:MAG: hypothetical protein U9R28_03770 [Pseudomonadota bacterium]|nr:hypothetical protein [Pseudomonadota bacterium]